MTVVNLCQCNYAEKEPRSRKKVSFMGKVMGSEWYCAKCNRPLSQKDCDTFAFELRTEDES